MENNAKNARKERAEVGTWKKSLIRFLLGVDIAAGGVAALVGAGRVFGESYEEGASETVSANGKDERKERGLELQVQASQVQPQTMAPSQQNISRIRYEDIGLAARNPEMKFADAYDKIITDTLNGYQKTLEDYHRSLGLEWNLKLPLSARDVKVMIVTETGEKKHRKGAFLKDPMQFANKWDTGFDSLMGKKEYTWMLGDFPAKLRGKHKTPRDSTDSHWDYSRTDMDGKTSIECGLAYAIMAKSAMVEKLDIESGDILEHTIQRGEYPSNLQTVLGTTSAVIMKYNPGIDARKLKIGQKVKYRNARNVPIVVGFRSRDETLLKYNGGGDEDYLPRFHRNEEEMYGK